MPELVSNKRIVKNTLLLYIRMLITMVVNLYASRVVLDQLGVEEFGVYNVVGGVVTMFTFLKGTMSAATSRFLTFELGRSDFAALEKTFSATLLIHVIIAIVVLILCETVGLWFVQHKLVIPHQRQRAVFWVFQFSVMSCMVSLTQVPYNASIIAHEKMTVFAYTSIVEAMLKLMSVVPLLFFTGDKLVLYSGLLFASTVCVALIYRIYCKKVYHECSFHIVRDLMLYKKLFAFSGWDAIGNISYIARTHGINIVLNLFCGPAINAARGIAYQVDNVIALFIGNFITALRPQIVKSYAVANYSHMVNLVFNACKISFLLFACFAIPVIVETPFILHLWLKNPPEYGVIFVRLILLNHLVSIMFQPIIAAVHASGNIKNLNLYAGIVAFLQLPLAYMLLKLQYPPEFVFYGIFGNTCILLIVNIGVLKQCVSFSVRSFGRHVFLFVAGASICSFMVTEGLHRIIVDEGGGRLAIIIISCSICLFLNALIWGFNKTLKVAMIKMGLFWFKRKITEFSGYIYGNSNCS